MSKEENKFYCTKDINICGYFFLKNRFYKSHNMAIINKDFSFYTHLNNRIMEDFREEKYKNLIIEKMI